MAAFERIEVARAVSSGWFSGAGVSRYFSQGAAADPQPLRDSAQRPLLHPDLCGGKYSARRRWQSGLLQNV